MSTTHPDYDRLWKEIVTELFESFLLFFSPSLYEQVDFTTPVLALEQEMTTISPESKSKKRQTDKLMKVQLKNGDDQWILVHIEVQGYRDDHFPKRMFRYFYRTLDKYNRHIFAIALFTDQNISYHTNQYKYSFYGTELTYHYQMYSIALQDEEKLIKSQNPFALAILAGKYVLNAKRESNELYHYKWQLMRLLLKEKTHQYSHEDIQKLFIFIDYLLKLPDDEAEHFVHELAPLIESEGRKMGLSLENTSFAEYFKKEGREEGIKEGRTEEKRKIAINMLKKGMQVELIAEITELSVAQILEMQKEE